MEQHLAETSSAVELGRIDYYLDQAVAGATRRGYRSDLKHFAGWCQERGVPCLPAASATVMSYAAHLAASQEERRATATIMRRIAAIAKAHEACGLGSPTADLTLRTLLRGIRRDRAREGEKSAAVHALLTEDIRRMVAPLADNPAGRRDRALILTGFAGGFRRSEVVALDVGDVSFSREGATVLLRRSKVDQEGKGRVVGLPYGSDPKTCPVRALKAWIETLGAAEGPLFRRIARAHFEAGDDGSAKLVWRILPCRLSGQSVALVVKRRCGAAGIDPRGYAGHSLRRGMATSAARNGASDRAIMNQTGHRTLTSLKRYIEEGRLFEENAAARLGH